jgi:hypothetical protein
MADSAVIDPDSTTQPMTASSSELPLIQYPLLQAHIAIVNRSSIYVLTEPRDEGIFDVGIAADDDPVMERGNHGGILPIEIGVDTTRKGVPTKNSP